MGRLIRESNDSDGSKTEVAHSTDVGHLLPFATVSFHVTHSPDDLATWQPYFHHAGLGGAKRGACLGELMLPESERHNAAAQWIMAGRFWYGCSVPWSV